MSARSLQRLFLALVLAVLAWGGLFLLDRGRGTGTGDDGGVAAALEGIDAGAVNRIVMVGPADTVTLHREETGWRVNQHRADSNLVARIWTALVEADVVGTAGTNPDNHERFGVSGPEAWIVGFEEDNGRSTQLVLGKPGTRYSSTYVRLPNRDPVVTVLGDLRSTIARTMDQWRDRSITAIDSAAVHSMAVTTDGHTVSLVRSGSAWGTPEGSTPDADAVRTLLGEIASLTATGFAPDSAGVLEGEASRALIALGETGDTLVSLVASEAENMVWVQRQGVPDVFTIAEWRADRVFPDGETLLPER